MRFVRLIAATLMAVVGLSGCAVQAPVRWHAGSGPIRVVASTDVWGSVASLVGGDRFSVDAIIYGISQDPHSHELSARDQLLVNNADIVVLNGGGYDDFMLKAIAADPTPAKVINAFDVVGAKSGQNEHVWYDLSRVGLVAKAIGDAESSLEPDFASATAVRVAAFDAEVSKKIARLSALRASPKNVFLTEPLVYYLVREAGYRNVTPHAFSNAIEEERDVPPLVLKEAIDLVSSGSVDAIYLNQSTETAQINSLLHSSKAKVYSFGELLPQDAKTHAYLGDYFYMLDSAIAKLEGK